MSTRNLLGEDHLILKAAFRSLLKAAGGPVYASQEITRADPARLSRYGNPNETMFAPLDVVRDLEAHVGEPIVSRVLADLSGHVLVEKKAATNSVDFDQHVARVAKEMSDIVCGLTEAKANGNIQSVVDYLLEQVREGQTVLANLEADISRSGTVVAMDRKRG